MKRLSIWKIRESSAASDGWTFRPSGDTKLVYEPFYLGVAPLFTDNFEHNGAAAFTEWH